MSSLIMRASARYLLWTMFAFSVFVLLRGHNEPGGGFIGGLFATAGLAVYAISVGKRRARALLPLDPKAVLGLGLVLALASGLPALLAAGEPYLTHQWATLDLGFAAVPLGTALIFDVGVYLVVIGAVTAILFEFLED
jgi:multicomponent Na+:H+ antiporter subunit B